MIPQASLVGAAAVLALALAGSAFSRTHAVPTLTGTVGPGFTITLTMNHALVQTLKAGTYRLVIHDQAAIHAFSMDRSHGNARDFTAVPFVETKTFSLKLKAGAYKYYGPRRQPIMFGRFTVTA